VSGGDHPNHQPQRYTPGGPFHIEAERGTPGVSNIGGPLSPRVTEQDVASMQGTSVKSVVGPWHQARDDSGVRKP
jgi:hypothetical protein